MGVDGVRRSTKHEFSINPTSNVKTSTSLPPQKKFGQNSIQDFLNDATFSLNHEGKQGFSIDLLCTRHLHSYSFFPYIFWAGAIVHHF